MIEWHGKIYTMRNGFCCKQLEGLYEAGCLNFQPEGLFLEVPTLISVEWNVYMDVEETAKPLVPDYTRIGKLIVCPFCGQPITLCQEVKVK